MKTFTLKIGRHEYSISESDRFMDNGKIVQLCSQSKEKSDWGIQANPVLSKKAVKEISKYERVNCDNVNWESRPQYFSLKIGE